MGSKANVQRFRDEVSNVQILEQTDPEYAERRKTRGVAGQEHVPLGIAIPKNAQDVAAIVRWATANGVDFAVRSGGNEFFGRNAVAGGLIIDMRDINFVKVNEDKTQATLGGGIIGRELLRRFEEEDIIAPMGNVSIIGYVGWATLGGYGPFTSNFGMGYEGILGAQVVTAKGEVVEASEEMLEGIRGLSGNLGVITALTIKVYPGRKVLSGRISCDHSRESIDKIIAAEAKMDKPKSVNTHSFMMKRGPMKVFIMFFTWTDPDMEKGQAYLDQFVAALGPEMTVDVKPRTPIEHYESIPDFTTPWGGQRSIFAKKMTPGILDTMMDIFNSTSANQIMGWSDVINTNTPSSPKNTFGAGRHIMVSFADMVPEEHLYAEARAVSDKLNANLRALKDEAVLDGAYISLCRTEDRTAKQLLGSKWERAVELKKKYDPENVFKYALPKIEV